MTDLLSCNTRLVNQHATYAQSLQPSPNGMNHDVVCRLQAGDIAEAG